LCGEDRELLTV